MGLSTGGRLDRSDRRLEQPKLLGALVLALAGVLLGACTRLWPAGVPEQDTGYYVHIEEPWNVEKWCQESDVVARVLISDVESSRWNTPSGMESTDPDAPSFLRKKFSTVVLEIQQYFKTSDASISMLVSNAVLSTVDAPMPVPVPASDAASGWEGVAFLIDPQPEAYATPAGDTVIMPRTTWLIDRAEELSGAGPVHRAAELSNLYRIVDGMATSVVDERTVPVVDLETELQDCDS
jgi:hypothetical protein